MSEASHPTPVPSPPHPMLSTAEYLNSFRVDDARDHSILLRAAHIFRVQLRWSQRKGSSGVGRRDTQEGEGSPSSARVTEIGGRVRASSPLSIGGRRAPHS